MLGFTLGVGSVGGRSNLVSTSAIVISRITYDVNTNLKQTELISFLLRRHVTVVSKPAMVRIIGAATQARKRRFPADPAGLEVRLPRKPQFVGGRIGEAL